jgi:AraC-like DNA-binding protein
MDGEAATGHLHRIRLGSVDYFSLRGDSQHVSRSADTARKTPLNLVKIALMTSGTARLSQGAVELEIGPGQLAVYETSRPYRLTMPYPAWRGIVLTVAPEVLGLPGGLLRHAYEQVHETAGAGRALRTVLEDLDEIGNLSNGARHRMGQALTALLAAALTDVDHSCADTGGFGLRDEVLGSITARLSDPALSTGALAHTHHVSRRGLQRLFEDSGRGVEGTIRDMRLEAIRRDLADPSNFRRPISDIAAKWCLTDASSLARSFRIRYGMSPSRYRQAVARSGGRQRDEKGQAGG